MALSRVQYEQEVADNRNFIVTMPYISRDHIKVSVTGNDVPFSWLNSNTVQLATAPNVGEIIDIRRETERQNLLVDFQDASTITEKQLDLATRQGFFLAQEAFDLTNSTMAVTEDGSFSASGRRISLLGDPDSDDDAATQGWVKGQYNSGKDAHQERLAAEQAAGNASGSEGRAKTSETNAAQSEGKAKTSETNAAQSETKAKTSETNSAQSESNARTSEVNAEAWAAGVNMPNASGNGLKLIRQKGDESGFEYFNVEDLIDRRNLIINGNFTVNQRGFNGNWSSLSNGAYGYDRWKRHANGVEQIVEGLGVKAGTVCLTWAGSGTGYINGQAVANGGTISVPKGQDVSVVVPAGSDEVKLEYGKVASPFVPDDPSVSLAKCQRYFWRTAQRGAEGGISMIKATGNALIGTITFPTTMRTPPAVTLATALRSSTTGTFITPSGVETPNILNTGLSVLVVNDVTLTDVGYDFDLMFSAEF